MRPAPRPCSPAGSQAWHPPPSREAGRKGAASQHLGHSVARSPEFHKDLNHSFIHSFIRCLSPEPTHHVSGGRDPRVSETDEAVPPTP